MVKTYPRNEARGLECGGDRDKMIILLAEQSQ